MVDTNIRNKKINAFKEKLLLCKTYYWLKNESKD